MARIRTIKPDFWRDEDLSQVSPEASLLAIGLLNVADDEGYFNANPKLLEADVFPLRELSITTPLLLQELVDIGYINLYSLSGDSKNSKKYGHVVNFLKHQVISKKTKSKISDLELITLDSGSPPVVLHTGKEGKGKERKGLLSTKVDDVQIIFKYWQDTLNHPKSILDKKRERSISSALKMGYSVDDIKSAINGCKKTPHNMGVNDNNQKYDDIGLIARDASNIDRFIANAGTHLPTNNQAGQLATRNVI